MRISNFISGLPIMGCSTERLLPACLLLVCPSLWAGLQSSGDDEPLVVPPSPAEEQALEPVDIGFLEFLGQWETDTGHWIAPEDLVDDSIADLIADRVPIDEDESE